MSETRWIKRFINGEVVMLTSSENKEKNRAAALKREKKFKKRDRKKFKIKDKFFRSKEKQGLKPLDFRSNLTGLSSSPAENIVEAALKTTGVKFIRECEFSNCINPVTNKHLRFDFYIPELRMCIEYDGKQHFMDKDVNKLADQKIRDAIKNKYCKTNKIKLVRLSSKQYYKLGEVIPNLITNRIAQFKIIPTDNQ
jgi:very-short-patch-repair endonuclease